MPIALAVLLVVLLVAVTAVGIVGSLRPGPSSGSDARVIAEYWRQERGDGYRLGVVNTGRAGVPADYQVKWEDHPGAAFFPLANLCSSAGAGPQFVPLDRAARCVVADSVRGSFLYVIEGERVRYCFPVYKRN